jgi:hypothetical protein
MAFGSSWAALFSGGTGVSAGSFAGGTPPAARQPNKLASGTAGSLVCATRVDRQLASDGTAPAQGKGATIDNRNWFCLTEQCFKKV